MSKITWIHLSDLHFGKNEVEGYEQEYILESLFQDVKKQIESNNLTINFIFFTGDITFKGDRESYNKASAYIKKLAQVANVELDNVVVVPGNHDITRNNIADGLVMPKTNKEIAALIGDEVGLQSYTVALENFKLFSEQTFGSNRYKSNKLFYTINREIDGKVVSVMALNTSWLVTKDIHQGQVVLGERQVREAFKEIDDADVIIALMHHPFAWLCDADNDSSKGLLEKRADFILNGHIHKVDSVGQTSIFGNAFHVSTGSIYDSEGNHSNAYNILSCDLQTGIGTVYFREYIDLHGGFWSTDNSISSDLPNGVATFKLPSRIPIQNENEQKKLIPTLRNQLNEMQSIEKMSLPSIPKALITDIIGGNCVLFAGAGTSSSAGLPTWYELLKNMVEELDNRIVLEEKTKQELYELLNSGKYLVVAEYCRNRLGENLFANFIHNTLKTKNRRSVIHELLSEIPFSAILTTNYDNFLERYRSNARLVLPDELAVLGYSGIRRITEEATPIIKLHGSFDNPQSIIFRDTDYRRALYGNQEYRNAINEVLQDKSCLFVGFSLTDINIVAFLQSILERNNSKAKRHYAILYKAGEVMKYYNENCLNITTISIDQYSQLLPLLESIRDAILQTNSEQA